MFPPVGPYWQAVGHLVGDIQVCVVRYRRKYYATNRLRLTAKAVREHSRQRHAVEAGIRTVKSQLGLAGCQAGYRRPGAEGRALRSVPKSITWRSAWRPP
jgi:hypothetical protein